MMDPGQRKEQWSQVYVRAIATAAGFSVYEPTVDDDSIDLGIAGRMSDNLPRAPRIELQLKGTAGPALSGGHLVYRLKRKNYDDLRLDSDQLLVPRLLVVRLVPKDEMDWHGQSESELIVRRCAYWLSLQGHGPNEGKTDKVTVRLPRVNVFSVEGLRGLMRRAAAKEPL